MRRGTPEQRRILATVLFTDIVGSTETATRLGDRRWHQLLAVHHKIIRAGLKRFHGREIDTAGDGFFATFDQPSDAIECALTVGRQLHANGIEIRAGVHMGEVNVTGRNVGGIAVHVGARVMSKAGAGEVLVSNTVRDLLTGSDLRFDDRGFQDLKGVEASMHLYAVAPPGTHVEESLPALAHPPEERRRRAPVAWAAVGIAALAAAVIAVVALTSGGGASAYTPAPNTVARLDAGSGELLGGVLVGTTPKSIVAGDDGRVWVANFDDQTIQSIDPSNGQAAPAQGVAGNPTGLAVGGDSVWVTTGFASGGLVQVDPAVANSKETITLDYHGDAVDPAGVAFGEDSVWVTDNNKGLVLRVDPTTKDAASIKLAAGTDPTGIAVGQGGVWVTLPTHDQVVRIDPSTNEVAATIDLAATPGQIAVGEGAVWVSATDSDEVIRIDPSTSTKSATIAEVGDAPEGIAVGSGRVWVANSGDGTVAWIDVQTSRVAGHVSLGATPWAVAATSDDVWVTIRG
jgi:YVTN family beta-propeller protein